MTDLLWENPVGLHRKIALFEPLARVMKILWPPCFGQSYSLPPTVHYLSTWALWKGIPYPTCSAQNIYRRRIFTSQYTTNFVLSIQPMWSKMLHSLLWSYNPSVKLTLLNVLSTYEVTTQMQLLWATHCLYRDTMVCLLACLFVCFKCVFLPCQMYWDSTVPLFRIKHPALPTQGSWRDLAHKNVPCFKVSHCSISEPRI